MALTVSPGQRHPGQFGGPRYTRTHGAKKTGFHFDTVLKRVVIPAKAGRSAKRGEHTKDGPKGCARESSRLNTSCRATKTFMSCALHIVFDWIPAFAGMTIRSETASTQPSVCCEADAEKRGDTSGSILFLHGRQISACRRAPGGYWFTLVRRRLRISNRVLIRCFVRGQYIGGIDTVDLRR